jgi:hypothetical protein
MAGAGQHLNAALTPTNVKATRSTTYGSYENSQPVRTGKDMLMVQRKRRKIRNLAYTYEIDGFDAGDLTLLAPHIGQYLFGQLAFQSEPEGWVWCTARRWPGAVADVRARREQDRLGPADLRRLHRRGAAPARHRRIGLLASRRRPTAATRSG